MKTYTYTNPTPMDPAAYLANGVIGLRLPRIPFLADTAFVQGYVGVGPEDGVEEMLPIPYPLGCDLAIDG